MNPRRVAITGLGVIAPLGDRVDALLDQLEQGRSGIVTLPPALSENLRSPIAARAVFDGGARLDAARSRLLDRVSQMALAAAAQAVADSGIEFSRAARERCGVFAGTGMGGAQSSDEGYRVLYAEGSDRIRPNTVLLSMSNAAASWIGIEYGLEGPNLTFSTACSSSAVAIGEAAQRIRHANADVMIAGGSEAPLCAGVLHAWNAMRVLATADARNPSESCRPFSRDRSGLVLGEGAAFVVMESAQHAQARGARIHAYLDGYGLTTDAAHITRPTVRGQARAMQAALDDARMHPRELDYINAHGTATQQNDATETDAIKHVFGEHARALPISSTKSMHGHLLGAAGALELIIAIGAINRRVLPPTMHLREPDPQCDLDYVAGAARAVRTLTSVMSNSFAFGGTNAVLIATTRDSPV